jgi:hypothetical protein
MVLLLTMLSLSLATCKSAPGAPPPDSVRIYFIYGSRPAKGYEDREIKWFGGIHGGHVAMEIAPNRLLSFRSTEYPCHLFPHKKFSSKWEIKTAHAMWETFPPHNYNPEDLKRAVFTIPVTPAQKKTIDSLADQYLHNSPYDYATLGMRCASATYEILAKAGVFKPYGSTTWWKIIMPKDLRVVLLQQVRDAKGLGWGVTKYEGSRRRVWEGD